MQRLMVWVISVVLGTVLTFVLFEFTPVQIPFIEGGLFTLISIILMAVFLAIVLDAFVKSGILDERGCHLGPYNPMGPIGADDPPPPEEYQPIVSREERLKQLKQ